MSKLFMDTKDAAALVGLTARHFVAKYVASGKLREVVWTTQTGKIRRRMFLRAEVEKLKEYGG